MQNDHDLLIELRTEMRATRADIAEIRSDVKERLLKLEDDVYHLKTWRAILVAIWMLLTVTVVPIAVAYFGSGHVHITSD